MVRGISRYGVYRNEQQRTEYDRVRQIHADTVGLGLDLDLDWTWTGLGQEHS